MVANVPISLNPRRMDVSSRANRYILRLRSSREQPPRLTDSPTTTLIMAAGCCSLVCPVHVGTTKVGFSMVFLRDGEVLGAQRSFNPLNFRISYPTIKPTPCFLTHQHVSILDQRLRLSTYQRRQNNRNNRWLLWDGSRHSQHAP